ncbi:hypothetical protein K402DRAFT_408882 [Aulographum hederae CBS 113979]|uniref:Uncharacterized protein n=1 Tax=Aulographum hederae CBS 113979 TaxID=1176131 RepID=A0A6G1GJ72_9PEZI|nr:hypothetical protein K402DRAFT_408882 [Aulographum hederae CBS 113979]
MVNSRRLAAGKTPPKTPPRPTTRAISPVFETAKRAVARSSRWATPEKPEAVKAVQKDGARDDKTLKVSQTLPARRRAPRTLLCSDEAVSDVFGLDKAITIGVPLTTDLRVVSNPKVSSRLSLGDFAVPQAHATEEVVEDEIAQSPVAVSMAKAEVVEASITEIESKITDAPKTPSPVAIGRYEGFYHPRDRLSGFDIKKHSPQAILTYDDPEKSFKFQPVDKETEAYWSDTSSMSRSSSQRSQGHWKKRGYRYWMREYTDGTTANAFGGMNTSFSSAPSSPGAAKVSTLSPVAKPFRPLATEGRVFKANHGRPGIITPDGKALTRQLDMENYVQNRYQELEAKYPSCFDTLRDASHNVQVFSAQISYDTPEEVIVCSHPGSILGDDDIYGPMIGAENAAPLGPGQVTDVRASRNSRASAEESKETTQDAPRQRPISWFSWLGFNGEQDSRASYGGMINWDERKTAPNARFLLDVSDDGNDGEIQKRSNNLSSIKEEVQKRFGSSSFNASGAEQVEGNTGMEKWVAADENAPGVREDVSGFGIPRFPNKHPVRRSSLQSAIVAPNAIAPTTLQRPVGTALPHNNARKPNTSENSGPGGDGAGDGRKPSPKNFVFLTLDDPHPHNPFDDAIRMEEGEAGLQVRLRHQRMSKWADGAKKLFSRMFGRRRRD